MSQISGIEAKSDTIIVGGSGRCGIGFKTYWGGFLIQMKLDGEGNITHAEGMAVGVWLVKRVLQAKLRRLLRMKDTAA